MTSFNPNKKRKRVIDQYKDNIISPPKIVSSVNPIDGIIYWKCNSNSQDKVYDIILTNNSGKMKFICSCQKIGSYHCKHIHAVIIKLCLTHIENSVDCIQEVNNIKYEIDEIVNDMENCKIDT